MHFPQVPTKGSTFKDNKKWLTNDIIVAKEDLKDWFHLKSDFPDFYSDIYRRKKKEYRCLIADAKAAAAQRLISSSGNVGKAVWQVVKNFSGECTPKKFLTEINSDGSTLKDPAHIASAFNNHFIESSLPGGQKCNGYSSGPMAGLKVRHNAASFSLGPVLEVDVRDAFNTLSSSKTCDVYDISPSFLKSISECLVTPLTILFNNSVSQGVFPDLMKVAKVIPVYKKGEKCSMDNYRPISILPSFSKIFERLVYNRLIEFLTKFSIISDDQFGFRMGKSTCDAINSMLMTVISALDRKEVSWGVFCDLSRAFDTVDHNRLLRKLDMYGVRGVLEQWFRSYLSGRCQCVQISHPGGKALSGMKPVVAGVPQGSILGPLLFLLYINDLTSGEGEQVIKYADDTSVVVGGGTMEEVEGKVMVTLNRLTSWFSSNGLSLNVDKTQVVHFDRNTDTTNAVFHYNNINMPLSPTFKFLGVHIDANLRWISQIKHICSSLNKSLYCLRQLSHYLSKPTLKTVYYGTVHPHLTYGLMFWGTCARYSFERVFKIQKRSMRVICGLGCRESCRCHFQQEEILTLPSLFISSISIFVYRNPQLFTLQNHSYSTRNKHLLVIPSHRTSLFQNSVSYLGPKIFNNLPEHVKKASSLNIFKSRLRSFLVDESFYSLEEFYSRGRN